MKKILTLIMTIQCGCLCNATTLVPTGCSIEKENVYSPLHHISFYFNDLIGVKENAVLKILQEGDVFYETPLSVENVVEGNIGYGVVYASYDPVLLLPKGKSYRIVISSGDIFDMENVMIVNDEIIRDFKVPSDLGDFRTTFNADEPVVELLYAGVEYPTEIQKGGEGNVSFYREGVLVREYPIHVSWDWDLGIAEAMFEETLRFEDGVHFAMEIPNGSIAALDRPDITNKNIRVDFTGGCKDELPTPCPTRWSFLSEPAGSEPMQVTIHYDRPIALLDGAEILLLDSYDNVLDVGKPYLKEGDMTICANFPNSWLEESGGYKVVIPAQTVVFREGDMMVNLENILTVEASGIKKVADDVGHVILYDLHGREVASPVSGSIYIRDGKKFVAE